MPVVFPRRGHAGRAVMNLHQTSLQPSLCTEVPPHWVSRLSALLIPKRQTKGTDAARAALEAPPHSPVQEGTASGPEGHLLTGWG